MNEIEEIFKRRYKELCIMSFYYLKDINEAQDIVQEVFVKVIERNKVQKIINVESYLKVAIRNSSLKRIKNTQIFEPIGDYSLFYNEENTDAEEALALKNKQYLYKQIDLLPLQCKRIFLLCVLDNMKYQETADLLGVSINTVKTQMKKAYKTLRSSLKHYHSIVFLLFSKKNKKNITRNLNFDSLLYKELN